VLETTQFNLLMKRWLKTSVLFLAWAGGASFNCAAAERSARREAEAGQPAPARPGIDFYEPDCPPLDEAPEYIVPLAQIRADLRVPRETQLPIDCAKILFTKEPGETRDALGRYLWARSDFWFAATDFSHQPLYWDNQPLERYGQSQKPILEPFFSGAHFFANFAIIPYKIGVDRTHDRIYTLGLYRPGFPAPCIRQQIPFEWDAATFEALAIGGFIVILP
jgi:hypothetical protein